MDWSTMIRTALSVSALIVGIALVLSFSCVQYELESRVLEDDGDELRKLEFSELTSAQQRQFERTIADKEVGLTRRQYEEWTELTGGRAVVRYRGTNYVVYTIQYDGCLINRGIQTIGGLLALGGVLLLGSAPAVRRRLPRL